MSSLHDHVAQNRAQGDARTEAETALLNAISGQVDGLLKEDGGANYTASHLKLLAEAYALVVHGKP